MIRIFILRLRRRRAVSTMIGGVIVLSLLLTALGTEVFVTQQYDQYEQTVNRMAQYRNQQWSENLVAISPGLTIVNKTVSGWGSGCDGSGVNNYNCYNATISNLGTVGIQITRIYINSTGTAGSGCSSPNPQPCILNPTSTIGSYAFNAANEFLNPGEANHQVILALPLGVGLPNPNPGFPQNTILIVTSRGNVFSFQWPFQVSVFGQSQSAFSSGNIKVAYTGTGFDSKNEPGPVAGGSGGTVGTGYCHTESSQPYPAGAGYAEKLTGITGYGDSGVLWFVNPWITAGNSQAIVVCTAGSGNSCTSAALHSSTTLYIYVVVINTGNTAYSVAAGTIDLTWYGSNHIDGYLIGVYYNSNFYPTSSPASIAPGASYYAIFDISIFTIGYPPWETGVQAGSPSVMMWGAATLTNAVGSSAEDQTFYSGTILLSGLWMLYEPSSGGCA
ncbi:MAG TPA: hypothetical protein VEG61_07555 [Candidatus Dormibacteraeota bacterium]|nr:hypothetical protein [Candidatus Dormibacteraeota bacterium]